MCCRCCGVTQQKCWVFGIGTLSLVSGLVAMLWWPTFIDETIEKQLPLTPKSRTFDKWQVTPIPIYVHMYLFNWTNPEDAKTTGIKPNFKQMGPYVYREMRKKENIVWHENRTVSFNISRTWFFEPEMSNGTKDDLITVPHLPSIAAAHSMRNSPRLIKIFFNTALNNNGGHLYVTHTADEWLFKGFYDEFLDYAMNMDNPLVPKIETNQFAWFLGRNGTASYEGIFTIHTGQGDVSEMGEIKYWKGQNHTGFYENECGKLNGSTSDLFAPNEPLETPLTIFITDTCRIINLEFTGEKRTIEGIEGWKYEATRNTFDNGQLNSDMKCYCPTDRQPNNCPATGATDLSPCADGAPMYMSAANFMDADPSYANTTTGTAPNYERDNFFIIMERKMGVPLQVNAAVQISLLISHDKDIDIINGVGEFYAPLFVTASRAIITSELAKELKLALNLHSIGFYVGVGLLCVGCILIFVGIVVTIKRKWYGQADMDVTRGQKADLLASN